MIANTSLISSGQRGVIRAPPVIVDWEDKYRRLYDEHHILLAKCSELENNNKLYVLFS